MRTFQFSDAKSHKFWAIDVQGSSFTVTYGKVGTAGQSQTKTFPSAEKAQAEADKLIREKTGKGYRETGAAAPSASAGSSDADAFERGLLDHRDEVVRWNAYSDYLSERGDARGEFMRVQLALEDESLSPAERKALAATEKKLLKAHEKEWLGPLAAFTVDAEKTEQYHGGKRQKLPPVLHAFERGWLGRVEFLDLTVNQARALAATKDAGLLRELSVGTIVSETREGTTHQYVDSYYKPGPDVPTDIDAYDGPGLHALCRCPHLAAVRSFCLGERIDESDTDGYSNCHTSGELAHSLVKQMPHVEVVELYAHRVDMNKLFVLPMPNLRSLAVFHSNRCPLDKLAANKTLTKLEALRIHPHAMDFDEEENGAYIRLKHIKAICRSEYLKGLTHLCLRLSDFGDAGVEEIISSGLINRLRVLDIQGGCVSDDGAKELAACPAVKNLQFLNLRSNALTAEGVAALKAAKIKANTENQHTTTRVNATDGEMPEYLFEGDIE